MQREASETQRLLLGLALGILPLTLFSVAVFTALITQPIRQLGRAIRQLGGGDLSHPIRVAGPHDLRDLGGHLDWLRERLRELEEQKTRFLQHMSHELKTPLTAIRESVDLIADRAVGSLNAQQAEIAQILRSNARELQSLIEDLLNFGTAHTQKPPLQRELVDLPVLIGEIARNHKPTLLAKNVALETALQPAAVAADKEKLGTVIDNLLSNAIKFTPAGGRIQVELNSDPGGVRLAVTDSGPGIAAEEREKVFDAFYQGKQRPSGYVKGSGLGLSIAREYVAAHEGSIAVLNREGDGACIEVILPGRVSIERKKATP
jgi:two-component system sensor histidine kinase GlrK